MKDSLFRRLTAERPPYSEEETLPELVKKLAAARPYEAALISRRVRDLAQRVARGSGGEATRHVEKPEKVEESLELPSIMEDIRKEAERARDLAQQLASSSGGEAVRAVERLERAAALVDVDLDLRSIEKGEGREGHSGREVDPRAEGPEKVKSVAIDLMEALRQRLETKHPTGGERSDRFPIDLLTGLPTLKGLYLQMGAALQDNWSFAVLVLNLDGFKSFNDQFGHYAGDLALVEIARRLKTLVSRGTVARVGGDDFALLIPNDGSEQAPEDFAERLRLEVFGPLPSAGPNGPRLTASVGVVLAPESGSDPEELVELASRAMSDAKKAGGDRVVFFGPSSVFVERGIRPR